MAKKTMATNKVYLMIKVRTAHGLVAEFNEFWGKESLPVWLEHGAKHVGSYTNYVGDPINEIVRLFEFESVAQWEKWERFLADSSAGKDLSKRLSRYIVSLERKLLRSVY